MRLYRTTDGFLVERDGSYYRVAERSFDTLVAQEDLHGYLSAAIQGAPTLSRFDETTLLAPIGHQEVWAGGVTYFRSLSARIEESKSSGGGDFYDHVYSADRPELFFKAQPYKVVGPGNQVRIRKDASWTVPEPELVLLVNPRAEIIGYTVGNDMSSRDIEGLNPLYLPQAKIYDGSCALGPCILVQKEPMPLSTQIQIEILRSRETVFSAAIALSEMKRNPANLVEYLFREQTFPHGCFLLTGTGIVPPDSFTLQSKDEIRISIEGIGTLANGVA